MTEKLLIYLSSFQSYVFITIIVAITFFIIINFLSLKLTVTKKRIGFLGLFYGLAKRDMIRISVSYLKLMFIIVCIATYKELEIYHYLYFLSLLLIFHLLKFKIFDFLLALLNSVMICIGFLVENMIMEYIQIIRFKLSYFIMYILFGILIILYSIYLFVLENGKISSEKRLKNVKIKDFED